jgi:hypothetical protein
LARAVDEVLRQQSANLRKFEAPDPRQVRAAAAQRLICFREAAALAQ